MKKIAITQRLIENTSYKEVYDALDIRWASVFNKLRVLPVVFPTNYDPEKYFDELDIAGVILSGGNDLSRFSNGQLSHIRDEFEKKIVNSCMRRGLPLLGVCRGMQLVTDHLGGTLKKAQGHVGVRHELLADRSSQFHSEISRLGSVNSFHNYVVEKLPVGFVSAATSADGYYEAAENKERKIFLQMWHCEREEPFNESNMQIIKKFFSLQ